MFKITVRTTNIPAIHFVALASLASKDLPLFLERNESELPLSAPESPDVLPDCMAITAMSVMHTKIFITTIAVFKIDQPFQTKPKYQYLRQSKRKVDFNILRARLQALFYFPVLFILLSGGFWTLNVFRHTRALL